MRKSYYNGQTREQQCSLTVSFGKVAEDMCKVNQSAVLVFYSTFGPSRCFILDQKCFVQACKREKCVEQKAMLEGLLWHEDLPQMSIELPST